MNVRHFLGVVPLIVAAIPVSALARDCNDVKAEIDAKIKAKGVTNYILRIVIGPDVKEGKIVGNCESGRRTSFATYDICRPPSARGRLGAGHEASLN